MTENLQGRSSGSELLIGLHVAEYQALMARLTNWITIQASLWAVLVLVLALAAQVWNSSSYRRVLAWGSVFMFQVVGIFWYQAQSEVYQIIRYVEKRLRPLVGPLVQDKSFWNYEKYLAEQRGEGFIWWEWTVALLCFSAIPIASI